MLHHLALRCIVLLQVASSFCKLHHLAPSCIIFLQIASSCCELHHLATSCIVLLQVASSCCELYRLAASCIVLLQVASSCIAGDNLHFLLHSFFKAFELRLVGSLYLISTDFALYFVHLKWSHLQTCIFCARQPIFNFITTNLTVCM